MNETIEQKCITKGVKLTEQRKIIAKVMSESNDHPDVDELYSRVSDILEQDIIKPDLVVYLQADTPLLMQYIKKRGRNLEKGVTSDYIDLVNQRYQEFFVNYEDTPLLIINTNNIDFVENPRDLDELLEIIQKPVQGIKYFNPS